MGGRRRSPLAPGLVRQLPPADAFPRAGEAAEEALRLDPGLAEAHVAMGSVKIYGDWDFAGGGRDLRHALELNPNSFTAHDALSGYLVVVGRPEEGLEVMRRGHRLDPLSFWANLRLGWHHYAAGRDEEALEWYGTTRQLFPHDPLVPSYMAEPLLALGRTEEALAACQCASSRSCAAEYALAGQPERARAVLEELEERLEESGSGRISAPGPWPRPLASAPGPWRSSNGPWPPGCRCSR